MALFLILCITSLDFSVLATSTSSGGLAIPGPSNEEQIAAIQAREDLSDSEKQQIIQKITYEATESDLFSLFNNSARLPIWNYINSNCYLYAQTTNYYCVPASIRSALRNLQAVFTAPSQGTIYTTLRNNNSAVFGNGCSVHWAAPYLNSNQTNHFYVSKSSSFSESTMKSNFFTAILNGAPPIVAVYTNTSNWPYNSGLSDHVVSIQGIKTDLSYVEIADTYSGYANVGDPWAYTMDTSTLFEIVEDYGIGYIH